MDTVNLGPKQTDLTLAPKDRQLLALTPYGYVVIEWWDTGAPISVLDREPGWTDCEGCPIDVMGFWVLPDTADVTGPS